MKAKDYSSIKANNWIAQTQGFECFSDDFMLTSLQQVHNSSVKNQCVQQTLCLQSRMNCLSKTVQTATCYRHLRFRSFHATLLPTAFKMQPGRHCSGILHIPSKTSVNRHTREEQCGKTRANLCTWASQIFWKQRQENARSGTKLMHQLGMHTL